jgi:hypothetical protein
MKASSSSRRSRNPLLRVAWISNVSSPATQQPSVGSLAPTDREQIFTALDGRHVQIFQRKWRVCVFSVSEDDGGRWLQLSLEGEPHYMVTVRASFQKTADDTLHALARWVANPSTVNSVLSVA